MQKITLWYVSAYKVICREVVFTEKSSKIQDFVCVDPFGNVEFLTHCEHVFWGTQKFHSRWSPIVK